MSFQQPPPTLGNQYEDDRVLRSYLARVLPKQMLREIEPSLVELGRLAGDDLYRLQLADRLHEPTLTQWDAWGNRIDAIEVTPLWREAERIAVEYGLVATAYEQKHGSLSRVHQCALAYLFTPSTDIYSCPLAMTDGAARTLLSSGNQALIDHALPNLISRNPDDFWTAGQWMTEITGGSDVGLSETVAVQSPTSNVQSSFNSKPETPNSEPSWRLYGNKWFASAITSQVALTLARPEGNPPGGRGLALFYLELRDESGRLRNIQINRLKDKLGTRKVPTAELTLVGTPARLVKGPTDGVRNIAPLLNITRLWNGISAVALMRRGLALAADYARRRIAFGAPLSEKPLHLDTLAGLQAEAEAAFHLAFYVAELTGRAEVTQPGTSQGQEGVPAPVRTGSGSDRAEVTQVGMSQGQEGAPAPVRTGSGSDRAEVTQVGMSQGQEGAPAPVRTGSSSDRPSSLQSPTSNVQSSIDSQLKTRNSELETFLLRLLTPVMKLTTAKQAVLVLSEVLEAFGGAGYVEDTGLPQLLRDAQVLPIWEGTTNVLSLDTLRALAGPTSNVQTPTTVGASPASSDSFQAFKSSVSNCLSEARDPVLIDAARIAHSAVDHAESWLARAKDQAALESGARRFALTLGRTMELALLIKHAQWSQDHEADARATAAARRFAKSGIDLIVDHDLDDARTLLR
jgi:alkylation response protein AidB-like acyl-CoA dehydrogenase